MSQKVLGKTETSIYFEIMAIPLFQYFVDLKSVNHTCVYYNTNGKVIYERTILGDIAIIPSLMTDRRHKCGTPSWMFQFLQGSEIKLQRSKIKLRTLQVKPKSF